MQEPRIALDNYKEVYDYFRDVQLPTGKLKKGYSFLNAIFEPRVSYADDASQDLVQINENEYPHIYAFNHRSNWDSVVIPSILHQIAPQDVGNLRGMTNSKALSLLRFIAEPMGSIPVFIKGHYRDQPELLNMLPDAQNEMFDTFACTETELRQKIYGCPEGEYNKHGPADSLTTVRRGMAEIACRIAQTKSPVAITPTAFAYGTRNWKYARCLKYPFNTSAYVERSILVEPDMSSAQVTELLRTRLLCAVQNAVALYR